MGKRTKVKANWSSAGRETLRAWVSGKIRELFEKLLKEVT